MSGGISSGHLLGWATANSISYVASPSQLPNTETSTNTATSSNNNSTITNNNSTTTNANTNTAAPAPSHNLDPKWLDIIMGKQDVVRMKECMAVLSNPIVDVQDKLLAFDELELLIESIDNANDLRPLGMWKSLLQFCQDPHEDMRFNALWCIGTAIQNNERAQIDMQASGGLSVILGGLSDQCLKVKQKALYCVSGISCFLWVDSIQ